MGYLISAMSYTTFAFKELNIQLNKLKSKGTKKRQTSNSTRISNSEDEFGLLEAYSEAIQISAQREIP